MSGCAPPRGVSLQEFISFARRLSEDYEAVKNALCYQWSNGQLDGQVNRLKLLKRMMYGRAKFALLRARVLHSAQSKSWFKEMLGVYASVIKSAGESLKIPLVRRCSSTLAIPSSVFSAARRGARLSSLRRCQCWPRRHPSLLAAGRNGFNSSMSVVTATKTATAKANCLNASTILH